MDNIDLEKISRAFEKLVQLAQKIAEACQAIARCIFDILSPTIKAIYEWAKENGAIRERRQFEHLRGIGRLRGATYFKLQRTGQLRKPSVITLRS